MRQPTLNLVAREGEAVREAAAQLSRRPPGEALSALRRVPTLDLPRHHDVQGADIDARYLEKILLRTYDRSPADFEALLGIEGVGAKTCARWRWRRS